jgi:hypothetical protein
MTKRKGTKPERDIENTKRDPEQAGDKGNDK